jgi:uncharacterized protein (DUF1697 family)
MAKASKKTVTTAQPKAASSREAHVALLRAINVGGNNPVPMTDLAALFTEAGCASVRTYIQSGNVVFEPPARPPADMSALLAKRIEARFGLKVPVVLRSASELAAVVRDNPFLAQGVDAESLHVMFLADVPTAEAAARLDPDRSPPSRFVLVGRDVYVHLPKGVARTKLTNDYFDRTLATVSTMRNWRTVSKLLEMARG